MILPSDAVTIRVMEEATKALSDRSFELQDAEPEVADGLLNLALNCVQQAMQLRGEESAYG